MSDLKIKVGVQVDETVRQVKADLKEVEAKLKVGTAPIKVPARIDVQGSIEDIKKQITRAGNRADMPKIPLKVEIDETSLRAEISRLKRVVDLTKKQSSGGNGGTGNTGGGEPSAVDRINAAAQQLRVNDAITRYAAQFEILEQNSGEAYEELMRMKAAIDAFNTGGAAPNFDDMEASLKAVGKYVKDLQQSKFDQGAVQKMLTDVNLLESKLRKMDGLNPEVEKDFLDAKSILSDLSNLPPTTILDQNQLVMLDQATEKVRRLKVESKELQNDAKSKAYMTSLHNQASAMKDRLESFQKANPKVMNNDDLASQYSSLMSALNNPGMIRGAEDMKRLSAEVNRFNAEAKAAGINTETFASRLSTIAKNFSAFTILHTALQGIKRAFGTMVEDVRALDKAMTELKKVTDETDVTYQQFFQKASQDAQRLGATISDVITSTADFARLGYTLDEASTLANAAVVYKSVGDGIASISDASESIISTMKAFGVSVEDTMGIVDRFNEVGNRTAISSRGIGEALKRSASALAAAGNTLDESIAMVVAANRTVQDPNKVGTALKTLSLRIRGAKTELEDAGESTEGMAVSVSKLREEVLALTGQKVDLMLDDTSFKSTYQILKEISAVWEGMVDVDQARLLELLAGKQQANILASVLTGFEDAERALEVSQNSAGSALKENEKYLESIEGKIQQLKASFESLAASVIDSDFFKTLIDGCNALVKGLDQVIGSLGAFSSAAGTAMAVGAFTYFDDQSKKGEGGGWKDFVAELQPSGGMKTDLLQERQTQKLNLDIESLNRYIELIDQGTDSEIAFEMSMKNAGVAAQLQANHLVENGRVIDDASDKIALFERNSLSTIKTLKASTLATQAMATAMNLLKGALVGVAAAVGVSLLTKFGKWLWDNVATSNALRDSIEDLNQEISSLENNSGQFAGLASEFEELSKKTSLSADEAARYVEIQNQMKDLLPSLKGFYDANGNFIVTETNTVEALTQAYQDLILAKQAAVAEEYTYDPLLRDSMFENDKEAYGGLTDERDKYARYIELKRKEKAGNLTAEDTFELGGFGISESLDKAIESMADIDKRINEMSQKWKRSASAFAATSQAYANATAEQKEAITTAIQSMGPEEAAELLTEILNNKENAVESLKNSGVYQDVLSGAYGGMDSQQKNLTISLGGIDKANAALKEYRTHQQEILNGEYEWTDVLEKGSLDAVMALDALLQKQNQVNNASNASPTPVTDLAQQKNIVTTFEQAAAAIDTAGKAYDNFIQKGSLSYESLSALQELFGNQDAFAPFIDAMNEGTMTADQLKNSLSQLVYGYLEEQGVLGQVNEATVGLVQSMLDSIGVANSEEVALAMLAQTTAAAADTTGVLAAQKFVAANPNLVNMTNAEIQTLITESGVSEQVAKMIHLLAADKMLAAGGGLVNMTADEIEKLKQEAIAAGIDTQAINQLNKAKRAQQILDADTATQSQISWAEQTLKELENFKFEIPKIEIPEVEVPDIDFSGMVTSARSTASQVSSEFQKAYDEIQYMRDRGLISEQEYLDRLYILNEKYNKNNLELWRKYDLEIYNSKKQMLQKQAQAYQQKMLKQIDRQIEALRKQKEQVSKYYDELIKAEQKKLDKLKEEWTEQDKLLKIEQARAALAKAESQRNVHIYREGQGFVWEADQDAIQDAQGNLDEAIKEHDRYLQEMEIQHRIDKLEEQKEAALEALDEEIEKLEEWRKAWEDALDMEEEFEDWEELLEEVKEFEEMNFEERMELLANFVDFYRDQLAELRAMYAEIMAMDFGGGGGGSSGGSSGGGITSVDKRPSYDGKGNPAGPNSGKGSSLPSYVAPDNSYKGGASTGRMIVEDPKKKYAKGTLSVPETGWYQTDEEGPEIKIPGKGTFSKLTYGSAVLPADISKNLWEFGKDPAGMIKSVAGALNAKKQEVTKTYKISFGNLNLPNVNNVQDFASELKTIVARAEQFSLRRT